MTPMMAFPSSLSLNHPLLGIMRMMMMCPLALLPAAEAAVYATMPPRWYSPIKL
jgi:hypothetical protein